MPLWFRVVHWAAMLVAAILLAMLFAVVMDRFPVVRLPLMSAACIAVTLLAGCFFCGSLAYMQYANFLPWLILERGNFPLPPYVRMLGEVHEKYPVVTSQGVMDSAGSFYASVADVPQK